MSDKQYLNGDSELNSEVIKNIVTKHFATSVPRYTELYDLYKGKHPILEKVIADPNKPNNKLVNNYYGEIVDTITGYFLGKPIVINHTGEDEAESSDIQFALDEMFMDNDKDDLLMEVGKECSIKGNSAVMVYQDEESNTQMLRIPSEEIIFIYDSNKPNTVLYAFRVYIMTKTEGDEEYQVKKIEIYDAQRIQYWEEDKDGNYLEDKERDEETHIFGRVPIVEFINNSEYQGDFEKVISLIDDFDKVFSNASNELEAFRDAYLMIKNMTLNEESIKKLQSDGILEVMEDGDVKFVTKNIPTEFLTEHLNRLEANIYRLAQTPNMSDEKFAGNLSGVAIRFKLFGLETKCIGKERKMTKGIRELLKLLSVPVQVLTGKTLRINDIKIQFTRNVPNNLVEIADVVTKLQSVVDKETLLSLLPFIDDVDKVIEALEKEADVYAKDMDKFTDEIVDDEVNEMQELEQAGEFDA